MGKEEAVGSEIVDSMGTLVMVSWVLALGPIGALLLGGIAYSMLAKHPAIGVLCAMVFFWPPILTAAWGSMRLLEFFSERRFSSLPATSPTLLSGTKAVASVCGEATVQGGMTVKLADQG
jgi:hypothetical protein